MPEPVVHELPLRWADLDPYNHVNNVAYLDYAAESRAMPGVAAGEPVARIAVDYLRPLLLSRRTIEVTSVRDGETLAQEIGGGGETYARVVTTLGPHALLPAGESVLDPYLIRSRLSDCDDAVVTPTKVFEYFQESRVTLLAALRGDARTESRFVVGRVEVDYGAPMPWRREPYAITSWVSRLGTSSLTVAAVISADDVVHARAMSVLVGFDLDTQRSRALEPAERDVVTRFIPCG